MAFTRFHDDTCRRLKQVQESTDPGLYYLNVPGNGVRPHYLDNNFVRLQKWGGNLSNNPVTIESDLRGLTRTLTRDHIIKNSYENKVIKKWIDNKIKLNRIGKVEDIMGAILFLASDASAMITGSSLMIDGGWTAG